jgi:hypothetical protein
MNGVEVKASVPKRTDYAPVPMEMPGIVKDGWKFGVMLAMVLSWSAHHSIAWAIVQGLAGWVYVVYYAVIH